MAEPTVFNSTFRFAGVPQAPFDNDETLYEAVKAFFEQQLTDQRPLHQLQIWFQAKDEPRDLRVRWHQWLKPQGLSLRTTPPEYLVGGGFQRAICVIKELDSSHDESVAAKLELHNDVLSQLDYGLHVLSGLGYTFRKLLKNFQTGSHPYFAEALRHHLTWPELVKTQAVMAALENDAPGDGGSLMQYASAPGVAVLMKDVVALNIRMMHCILMAEPHRRDEFQDSLKEHYLLDAYLVAAS